MYPRLTEGSLSFLKEKTVKEKLNSLRPNKGRIADDGCSKITSVLSPLRLSLEGLS